MVWFRWVVVSASLQKSRQKAAMLNLLTSLELCLEAIFGHLVWGVCDT